MYSLENTLAKIQIHWMLYFRKTYTSVIISILLLSLGVYVGQKEFIPWTYLSAFFATIILIEAAYLWIFYKLWKSSALYITSHRIHLEINHSLISKYAMDLYYHRLRDTAFSFNSLPGRLMGYGTFFGRSGIGGDEEHGAEGITATHIPHPDRVKGFVNYIISLPEDKRMFAMTYEEFMHGKVRSKTPGEQDKEKHVAQILHSLKGIKEVRILHAEEKDHLWQHEELRNIGVFETLMRRHTIVFTHDSTWRPAVGDLVLKRGERIIFPGLPFPEVKEPSTISASPGKDMHDYLSTKVKVESNDATVLVGFN